MNKYEINKWEVIVGRFMLATGQIELRLLQLSWNFSIGGHYDKNIKAESFSRKINTLKKDIRQSGIAGDFKEEICNTLDRCFGIVKIRNLVAHNPISMSVLFDGEGFPQYAPLIQSLRDDRNQLNESDLIDNIEETRMIDEEFRKILIDNRLWNWRNT